MIVLTFDELLFGDGLRAGGRRVESESVADSHHFARDLRETLQTISVPKKGVDIRTE